MSADKKIRLESTELSWLCEQIALVQRSGIPLPEGIELLAESADLPRQAEVLRRLNRAPWLEAGRRTSLRSRRDST